MRTRVPVASLILLLAAGPAPAQSPTTGALGGQVLDTASGQPLAGATVVIATAQGSRTTATGSDGTFRFSLLPPGTWAVTVVKDGYVTVRLTVKVGAGGSETLKVLLRAQSAAACTVEVVASTDARTCYLLDGANVLPGSRAAKPGLIARIFGKKAVPAPAQATAPQWGGAPLAVRQASAEANTEAYDAVQENPFKAAASDPLSTFGADVDTASYTNVRRFLSQGQRPPRDAVRIEELLNYFRYDYPQPAGDAPFSVNTELTACPWAPTHRLLRIGLQGRRLELERIPPRNLVFLIDVSGSMSSENRLPLVKRGLARLVDQLRPQDSVAIVVYAGSSGLVLPPTSGADKATIQGGLGRLEAGGSTNGGAGIQLAYATAKANFRKEADNRVILCTDGDFNVGISDRGSLEQLIEAERKSGVFLTCMGFGMGNYKDATIKQLADKGNGHYAYIDSLLEMERVFGDGGASLVTIAKDVKLQVEFNPAKVQAYRLLGYENRLLAKEDFNDDAKDAGEINLGHSVTALYELVPPGEKLALPKVDGLKYQKPAAPAGASSDLLTVKLRYKAPDGDASRLLEVPVADRTVEAGADGRWAAAVAAFGMVLRDSPHKGAADLGLVQRLAQGAEGKDELGYRAEFLRLVGMARQLRDGQARGAE